MQAKRKKLYQKIEFTILRLAPYLYACKCLCVCMPMSVSGLYVGAMCGKMYYRFVLQFFASKFLHPSLVCICGCFSFHFTCTNIHIWFCVCVSSLWIFFVCQLQPPFKYAFLPFYFDLILFYMQMCCCCSFTIFYITNSVYQVCHDVWYIQKATSETLQKININDQQDKLSCFSHIRL